MPSKSQIDFALRRDSVFQYSTTQRQASLQHSRFRVMVIQESASIMPMEDTAKTPWLVLERLHVLDLDDQDIARFSGVDVKRTGQVVDLREVYVFDVVRRVVVLDLSPCPVEAFDLDSLSLGDLPTGRD